MTLLETQARGTGEPESAEASCAQAGPRHPGKAERQGSTLPRVVRHVAAALRHGALQALALALAAGFSLAAQAAATLHDFELRRLDAPQAESLDRYAGRTTLLMLFEPGCSWCLKQSRAIDTLLAQCPQFAAAAIGVHGNRRDLRSTFHRYRADYPAYQASASFISALGGVDATPFTLVSDGAGRPLGWLQGYLPAEQLHEAVSRLAGESCNGAGASS